MNVINKIAIVCLAVFLCGCTNESSNATNTVTGKFIDDPVGGVDYTCSSGNSGTTNPNPHIEEDSYPV